MRSKSTWQKLWPHLLFWAVYIAGWSLRELVYHDDYIDLLLTNLFFSLFYAPFVYLHYYLLVPRLLLRGQAWLYVVLTILTIIATAVISTHFLAAVFTYIFVVPEFAQWLITLAGRLISISELILLLSIAVALFFMEKWYQKDRYAKELEKQNLEAELNLLKTQINPHFVFNTLNTIYHLMGRDTEQARAVLMKFSDSLSHQLYDTDKDRIPLEKEVEYLRNYIAIQKVRSGDALELEEQWSDEIEGKYIAPMLLMPLVENAFKHGKTSQTYQVKIHLSIQDSFLHFTTENTVGAKSDIRNGGLGLANLQRRLALMYPDRHTLETAKRDDIYRAELTIKLDADELPDHR